MILRKFLLCLCLFVFGLTLLYLSVPRAIAYSLVFPHKRHLTSTAVLNTELSSAIGAYREAYSWHEFPGFLIAESRLLAKSSIGSGTAKVQSIYSDRMALIEKALQKGGYNPYQLLVLANLRYLNEWDLQTVIQSLELSIATGPYVGALYFPRFKSLSALWGKLSKEQRREFLPDVTKAYKRYPDEVITLSRKNKLSFLMVRAALRDEPREVILFVRQVLKK